MTHEPDDENDYDGYEVVEPDDRPPPFPITVRAAGITWLVFGTLTLLLGFAGMALQAAQAAQARAAGANPPPTGGGCCGLFIPAILIWVGYQTVTGKAKSTLGNGIGSLIFACLYLGVGALVGLLAAGVLFPRKNDAPGFDQGLVVFAAAACVFVGLVFGLAGVLALVGRRRYDEWKAYHDPNPSRRRRR